MGSGKVVVVDRDGAVVFTESILSVSQALSANMVMVSKMNVGSNEKGQSLLMAKHPP